jgi:NADPH2:quinone reductase
MKALQVTELTGPDAVRIADIPEPSGEGEVLIDVHAVGVSFPDLLRSQGLYQEKVVPPYVLGNEVAGVVVSAPAGSGYKAGDRVVGSVKNGAAERAAGPASTFNPLPDELSFDQGAAVLLNYRTAILALDIRGKMKPGETVLVHGGAGGTGTATIQIAQALGGKAFAVVSSDDKERIAKEAGADLVFRSDGPWKDQALEATGGKGVDLVFDPVGGDRIIDTMRALKFEGRWLIVGFVGGGIPQIPANRVLLRSIDVVGVYYGGHVKEQPEVGVVLQNRIKEWVASGHIRPVVGSVFPMDRAADALRSLGAREALGKVVLRMR